MPHKNLNDVVRDQYPVAEMLTDSSIDRVMAIDNGWNIIAWNRTSELITGISRNKVLGKNLLDTFPQILNDKQMLEAITMAFEGKKCFLPSVANSFNRHYCENHFIPLRNANDSVIGVMNIIHDVAHRIKVEKQLQRLNAELEKRYQQLEKANDELANFTYVTSRDVKEPLKHVYTSLEFLIKKEGASLSNMSKGNLRRMQGSLNKINLLIDDLTAVASITTRTEPLEEVDLDGVFAKITNGLKNKINERRAEVEADTLPVIPGYKRMIEYLFHHLLDNAIKFQDDDQAPKVKLTCDVVKGGVDNNKELTTGRDYLKISFHDNGIGFEQEDADKLFNLFEKLHGRKYHGSGVGLTICKKIIEAHDGFIEAISSTGNGACFNCFFPVDMEE